MDDVFELIKSKVVAAQAAGQPLEGVGYNAGRVKRKAMPYVLMEQVPAVAGPDVVFATLPRVEHARVQFTASQKGMTACAAVGRAIKSVFDGKTFPIPSTNDTAYFSIESEPTTALDGQAGDAEDVYACVARYEVTINRNA